MRRWLLPASATFALLALGRTALAQTPDQAPPAGPVQSLRQVAPEQAVAVLGVGVMFADGTEVGRIVDVLVNATGTPEAAVLDCGGFLGMGNRRVAVAWDVLHFAPSAKPGLAVTIELTPDQVRSAPDYKPAEPAKVVAAPSSAPGPAPSAAPSPAP